jgi:CRP/FNR family transcriptional regulator, cyclic AMP receptor protein
MKFAARDGSTARTLAFTSTPATRSSSVYAAPGWYSVSGGSSINSLQAPPRPKPSTVSTNSVNARRQNGSQSTVTFLRGQEVFTPGTGDGLVYIVRSGCIRLYKVLPDGRSINLGLLGPGTVFTQEDTSEGIASGSIAEALVDSTLSIVETSDLASLIAESPELAEAMVMGMSRRMTEVQTLVEHLLVRDTAVRLAVTLMNLAQRFGRPTADGMMAIALPLTHQSLANMIGSNRVTVTRKLLELQEGDYVRSLGRNAIAVDVDKLRDYAQAAGQAR